MNHTQDHPATPATGQATPRSVANPRRTQLDADGRPTAAHGASLPPQD
jgi:hypothetical protein